MRDKGTENLIIHKINCKMVGINLNISIITLTLNSLNTPNCRLSYLV